MAYTQNPTSFVEPVTDNVEATVTIGVITPDGILGDSLGKYDSTGNPLAIWTDCTIRNRYEKDKHIYMMGVTSPGGFQGNSVAFAQMANPTLLRIVEWTVCRFNQLPDVPDPRSVGSNWILLDDNLETVAPEVAPDETSGLYRLSGYYVYGCINPAALTIQNATIPRKPYLDDAFFRLVPLATLVKNLLDPVSTGRAPNQTFIGS